MHSQGTPVPCKELSNVIGLSDLVTQPISYKVPPLFPFLKKYIQSALDFPVCQCSLRWLPAMSADRESHHCCTLARLLLHLQQLGKEKDGREPSDTPSQGDRFFPRSFKPHGYKLCPLPPDFVMMLEKTGKPVSSFPEWKWPFKKSISVVSESFYLGNPFLQGGPSFEPHFRDVFSVVNGNDRSASSGIQCDVSRI